MLREFHHEHAGFLFAKRDHKLISVPRASSALLYFTELGRHTRSTNGKMQLFGMSGRSSLVCCFDYGWLRFRFKDFRLAIHHGTQKRTDLSIESWILDRKKLLRITCMRSPDLLARTESKRRLQRLGTLQKDGPTILYAKDLPNATIQPFRVWHPSGMKTGLRNRPIGRKIAII
jgi:hypothetical protein